jgi:hypothetical protein
MRRSHNVVVLIHIPSVIYRLSPSPLSGKTYAQYAYLSYLLSRLVYLFTTNPSLPQSITTLPASPAHDPRSFITTRTLTHALYSRAQMVLDEVQKAVFGGPLPNMRPSKAHPEERAKRKQLEKESPHFNMQDCGLKTAALVLLAAVACFPWEKKREEHVREKHPERLEGGRRGNGERRDEGRREGGRREGERRHRGSLDYRHGGGYRSGDDEDGGYGDARARRRRR